MNQPRQLERGDLFTSQALLCRAPQTKLSQDMDCRILREQSCRINLLPERSGVHTAFRHLPNSSPPDPYLRRAALEAIGDHPSGRDASDVVLSMLHDRNGFVVRTACDVAAVLGLAGAHDRILELVGASEEATRLSALRALEGLWMP